jgi:Uma2 family endonuclease
MTTANSAIEQLYSGDRMTRVEFHRIYEQTPQDFHAELIGGIVYLTPQVTIAHGSKSGALGTVLFLYERSTSGVECGGRATILLGQDSEPEPDAFLRLLPECGGQSSTTADDYLFGAPEMLAEIAYSSRAIDLHAKKLDYARYGVLEYLVVCLREKQLRWFDLCANRELTADADGVLRVRCFPGLWINADALLARDARRMLATLDQGLASPEHAELVRQLAARRPS